MIGASPSASLAEAGWANASPASPRTHALTTRFLDFWMLGGLSIFVWVAMVVAQQFRGNAVIDEHFASLRATALTLALVLNYPHFLVSYKLAYSRGSRFVAHHWWALIGVPLLLVGLFAVSYRFYDVPVRDLAFVVALRQRVVTWGVNAQILAGPRLGDVLMAVGFNLMIFTIGWHYTKQVFGCMMVYAHYDAYPLTPEQRTLTRRALLSVWAMSFVDNNVSGAFRSFGDFSYSSLDLPDAAAPLSELVVIVGAVLVLYRVFYSNYRTAGRLPSATMLVPFVSLYVWWLPQTRQDDFYFLLVPLFHSLQYLPFAYKMEEGRLRDRRRPELRGVAIAVGVGLAGWLAFELVPHALDVRLQTVDMRGLSFFMIAATLFINIHHYFIDSVAWRFKDAPVRQYLLG